MSGIPDYYADLGLAEDAGEAQIKSAFRKLAKAHHPDRNGNPDRFKRINEAYEVLSDPQKRTQYDQMRRLGPAGFAGANGMGGAEGIDLEDLFGSFFGQFSQGGDPRQRGPRRARGQDVEVEVEVPFTTAALGGGASVRTTDGKRLDVTIPAGTETGARLRLRGQGRPGRHGGDAGDLLVRVRVAAHPQFRREGDNIAAPLEVDWLEMVLGGTCDVATLHGTVELTLPAGVQPGTRLRIAGHGLRPGSRRGDHFAILRPRLPTAPTAEEKALLEQLKKLRDSRRIEKDTRT